MRILLAFIIVLQAWSLSAFVPLGYIWPTDEIPVSFYMQPSVNSAQSREIVDGFNVWTMVETTLFEFSFGGTNGVSLGINDGINNNGFGTSFQGGGSLAVTLFWFDAAGNLTDADVEYNSTVDWGGAFDLMTIAIHEAGHVLGMGHEMTEQSIMQPIYFGTNQTLFQDDIDGVGALYPGRKIFVEDDVFQNAPNPFVPDTDNDYTVIGYSVKADGPVKLELYTLAGELVKVLVDEHKTKGEYIGTAGVRWYGDNGSPNVRGKKVASGVYIVALRTSRSKTKLKKIMIIR